MPCVGTLQRRELLRADGQDLLALDFDFDSVGRANVAALDYGAAHPDVAREIGCFEGIVKSAAARIANQGVIGAQEAVFVAEPAQVGDIFELAGAIRRLAGEGPVARGKRWGTRGQTDDGCGDILPREAIAEEEIGRGPRFGEVGHIGDGRARLCCVGEEGGWIWRWGRNFQLGSLFRARGFGGFGSG